MWGKTNRSFEGKALPEKHRKKRKNISERAEKRSQSAEKRRERAEKR
jgi:hypothetical protein